MSKMYFDFVDELARAGWRRERKESIVGPSLKKRVGGMWVTVAISKSFTHQAFINAYPTGGYKIGMSEEARAEERAATTREIDFQNTTAADVETAAREVAAEARRRSVRKKPDWSKFSSDAVQATGEEGLAAWKKRVEEAILEIFGPRSSGRLNSTELVIDNVFSNYGLEPGYPMSRRQGARIVRQILERLAKQRKIEKCTGGMQIDWARIA